MEGRGSKEDSQILDGGRIFIGVMRRIQRSSGKK